MKRLVTRDSEVSQARRVTSLRTLLSVRGFDGSDEPPAGPSEWSSSCSTTTSASTARRDRPPPTQHDPSPNDLRSKEELGHSEPDIVMIEHTTTKAAPSLVGGLLECEHVDRVHTYFV